MYQASCQSCEMYTDVNDLILCSVCNGKLERDLIRQGEYSYVAKTAFANKEEQKQIRSQIIKRYGKGLELIQDKPSSGKKEMEPIIRTTKKQHEENAQGKTHEFSMTVTKEEGKWVLHVNEKKRAQATT